MNEVLTFYLVVFPESLSSFGSRLFSFIIFQITKKEEESEEPFNSIVDMVEIDKGIH